LLLIFLSEDSDALEISSYFCVSYVLIEDTFLSSSRRICSIREAIYCTYLCFYSSFWRSWDSFSDFPLFFWARI